MEENNKINTEEIQWDVEYQKLAEQVRAMQQYIQQLEITIRVLSSMVK